MPRTSGHLLLAFAALFWAGNALLGRAFHEEIPPVALAFSRWSLATVLLLPFAWKHMVRDRRSLLEAWPVVLVLSVLGISTFNTILYHAAHTTTATNIALIQTMMPATIVGLELLLFAQGVSTRKLLGVLLAMGGGATVVLRGNPGAVLELDLVSGDVWMTGAMVIYALYSVLLRRRPQVHPLSLLGATFVVGTLLLIPVFLWEWSVQGSPRWSSGLVAAVLYVAVFPSILAYFFWNRGVEEVGAGAAGLYVCLVPVFTAVLAVPILGEALHAFHLAGFLLIAGGIVLFRR